MISLKNVDFSYGGEFSLKNINMEINDGKIISVLGPNGSGKTTLLKIISGIINDYSGDVFVDNYNIKNIHRKILSRIISYVPQDLTLGFDFSVKEIVMMGRYPHIPLLSDLNKHDLDIVKNAMEITGIKNLENRSIREISGGEKQRVLIARAIAQESRVIVLDEPTSNLDIKYQLEIMKLLNKMVKNGDKTVIMSMHDINLSIRFCDEIFLMNEGKMVSSGKPDEVINDKILSSVYGINAKVLRNGDGRIVYVFPDEFNGHG
ncbi:MAG: ABC transporter ATP-binding protein [Thermoplasmata archaeon]